MKTENEKFSKNKPSAGSALILAVVLTSLLAIVGVLFVMVSRVDKMATSAISENKELNLAVETVVEKISQELVLDVPGIAGQEYYDYPDVNDIWLSALEPYQSGNDYYWRQTSDVYYKLDPNLALQAVNVPDYQDAGIIAEGVIADADGDGVADSQWVIIPDMSSSKGRPIYAAIKIIDNGAMLNVNTAYKFDPSDPNTTIFDIGGSPLQINLLALAGRPGDPPTQAEEIALLTERANPVLGVNPLDLSGYEENIIWHYGEPDANYTPFDISDELELRYRFLLNHSDIDTRLEQWGGEFRKDTLSTPVASGGVELDTWFKRACDDGSLDPNYAYRHIATAYNMDRIINPAGLTLNNGKMVNVNTADANLLYDAIRSGLLDAEPNFVGADGLAAQLAVNIVDLRDSDADVTVLPIISGIYYGFEAQPFISDVAFRISSTGADVSTNNHFAIELYNPLDVDIPLGDFRLEIRDPNGTVVSTINLTGYAIADGSRFVLTNNSAASGAFGVTGLISAGGGKEDPELVLAKYIQETDSDPPVYTLSERYDIYLLRTISAGDVYLDKQQTQDAWFNWDTVKNIQQFYARADNNWNVVYQDLVPSGNTLGRANGLTGSRKNYNFYNFANAMGNFVSVGDIARAFTVAPSTDPNDMIGVRLASEPLEAAVRLDLQNPVFANIFKYLIVIDPTKHIDPNDYTNYQSFLNEMRIQGRININTAPWFVIAQLPWVQPAIAQAVVAYRDTIVGGFESIAGLIQVPEMGYYAYDPMYSAVDLDRFPDLTPNDGAVSDFEERDVIFSRISNLVTVRSDVFTAYILVRVGADGPQKRFIAILDRSQVDSSDDKVRIIALHPVPDPR
ncbi:MAG: helix-hairpin-helix domain-containing protein [Planctomycetota bacterium]|jgi:hypothetical protein